MTTTYPRIAWDTYCALPLSALIREMNDMVMSPAEFAEMLADSLVTKDALTTAEYPAFIADATEDIRDLDAILYGPYQD